MPSPKVNIPQLRVRCGCIHCSTPAELLLLPWYRDVSDAHLRYQVQVAPIECSGCGEKLEVVELVDAELKEYFTWYKEEAMPLIPLMRNMDEEKRE